MAVLEQYRLYVEAADRVSERRASANGFFVTLNTAVIGAMGAFAGALAKLDVLLLVPIGLAILAECLAWFWVLRSYRQLNTAKYAVVGALEEWLPTSPWWRAEWMALGEGRDPRKYWPLSHVEEVIPGLFATAYLVAVLEIGLL